VVVELENKPLARHGSCEGTLYGPAPIIVGSSTLPHRPWATPSRTGALARVLRALADATSETQPRSDEHMFLLDVPLDLRAHRIVAEMVCAPWPYQRD